MLWITTYTMKLSVVPYVGTWIEMESKLGEISDFTGRSLRGNVDRNLETVNTKCEYQVSFPTWERG